MPNLKTMRENIKKFFLTVFRRLKKVLEKKYKWLIAVLIFLALGWFSGFGIGWWWSHGRLSHLSEINAKSRILILSPHPDNEALIAGGLM